VPFTISHAAAALPLRTFGRFQLPLAALMIGSMSPDFAYFLPGELDRVQTHSIPGVFWFCWPVSLALWLVFANVLEYPTLALMTDHWRTRFASSDLQLSFTNLALASVAVILGALTHLLWDSFTHRGTAIVDALPALHAVAFHYHGWRVRWFVVLQHLSSVVGMLLLMIWAWRLPPGRFPRPSLPSVSHATRVRCALIVVAASLALAITGYLLHPDTWFVRRLFYLAVGGMSGLALSWLGISLWMRWRKS
jgi:uncharacterized protein DUF4184